LEPAKKKVRAVLAARQENDPRCGSTLKIEHPGRIGGILNSWGPSHSWFIPSFVEGAVRGVAHATLNPDTYPRKSRYPWLS